MRQRSGGLRIGSGRLRIGSMRTSLPLRFSLVENLQHDVAYRNPSFNCGLIAEQAQELATK
jgi:hypothetical protein